MSEHICPECKRPLFEDFADGEFLVCCQYGPCPSEVCADGAMSITADAAFGELMDRWANERVEKEDV